MRKSILEKIIQVSKGGHQEKINLGKNLSSIKGRAPGENQSWKNHSSIKRRAPGENQSWKKSLKYQREGTGRKSILEKIIHVSKGGHREEINPEKKSLKYQREGTGRKLQKGSIKRRASGVNQSLPKDLISIQKRSPQHYFSISFSFSFNLTGQTFVVGGQGYLCGLLKSPWSLF